MKRNLAEVIGPTLGVALFGAALWVLHHELERHHYREIAAEVAAIAPHRMLGSLVCTAVGYALLTGYDALALRHLGKALPFRRISLASFTSYALSHNIGFSFLSGATVRYRLYSALGLSGLEIAQVVAFCGLTFWVGFLAIGGVAFLLEPMALPAALHLPFSSMRLVGACFLALVAAYATLCIARRRPVRIRDWQFLMPAPTMAVAQIAISSLDWSFAGAALYALLPPASGISFPHFMGVFLLAQAAGLVSQVPGGLGVFETVVLVMLSGSAPASSIFGALLAYRGIYYLLPLAAAAVLLGAGEIARQRERIRRAAHLTGQWGAALAPSLMAFTTFMSGAVLLLSGATPGRPPASNGSTTSCRYL